jgi:hypothetical protein
VKERSMPAQSTPDRIVRLAELEIDPAQLDAYKTALRDSITRGNLRVDSDRAWRARIVCRHCQGSSE